MGARHRVEVGGMGVIANRIASLTRANLRTLGGWLALLSRGDGWHREDRRLFAGALNGIVFFLALAIVLRRVDWEFIREVKVWATTLQFVGALVASGGLLYAYRRATRPIPVVVRSGPAHL